MAPFFCLLDNGLHRRTIHGGEPIRPTMKGRLASKKAEVEVNEPTSEQGGQTRIKLHRPEEKVSETVILGKGPEAAPAVVDLLEELGVL